MSAGLRSGLLRRDGSLVVIHDRLTIGRGDENDLRIDHDRVSRRQAVITLERGAFWIEDLKSSNGTRVNKRPIAARTELKDGDELQVGPETFRVRRAGRAPEAGTVLAGPGGTMLDASPAAGGSIQVLGGARFNLDRPVSVGRDAYNTIALPADNLVSARHARLERQGGRLLVTDLGSSNGTRRNGRRIQAPTALRHGDRIRVGRTMLVVTMAATGGGAHARRVSLLAGIAALAAVLLGAGLLGRLARTSASADRPALTRAVSPPHTQEQLERDALRAMVQVATPQATGSGSLISEEGLVLTNAHVVAAENSSGALFGFFREVEVRVNRTAPGERPNETYKADVLKVSQTFDLALLRIRPGAGTGTASPGAPFPAVPIGNSDSLDIGANMTVLGYPGIGGAYPTLTRGTMSGFMADDVNGIDHGWIKTDTEINYGNSGGMAVNRLGQLVGVPTQIRPSFMPTRLPVTAGKLGLIRPINVARMFLSGYVENRLSSPRS